MMNVRRACDETVGSEREHELLWTDLVLSVGSSNYMVSYCVGRSVYYDTWIINHMWQCFRYIGRNNIMYNICRISKKAQISMTVSWTEAHKAYKCSPDSQTHKIKQFLKGDWLLSSSATKT